MRSVITIGRQFGSGGREIGRRIAEKYDIPFYDKELITQAAKDSGICEETIFHYDENVSGSLLFSLITGGYSVNANGMVIPDMPINQRIFLAQFDAIKKLSCEPCVIVGRCADYVLSDRDDCVSVFITGDLFEKKRRIAERYDIEKPKIEDFIKKTDKRRANYYEYYTDKKWGAAASYDLTVNSSLVGIEGAVKLICDFVALKENHHR